jgi:integrase
MVRRTLSRLSVGEVKKLSKVPGRHADGGGLYLQVSPAGVASWTYRYQIDGRERFAGLGPLHAVSLKEAREKAAVFRKLRHGEECRDPLEERRARRLAAAAANAKTMTFAECAERYIAAKRPGWKNPKHAAQWPSTLQTYVYPIFGDLPVQAVDVGLVMRVIEPIWNEKPETASRVRGRIESVLGWATTRGYRDGANPARWKDHLEHQLSERSKVRAVKHHAALPYAEIAEFMAELRQQEGIPARALEFAILTAARTFEALGCPWSEIDFKARLWTIPAERMKAERDHRVPLSARSLSILEGMQALKESEFVFPGIKPGLSLSDMSMLMTLRRMGRGDLTVHGFRSTFRDWAAERTGFPAEVAEMALAHAVGDKVEAAYRRGDLFEKRRQLSEAWARFCSGTT